MITLSRKAAAIEPSVTLEISAKAKAMKAEGKKIVAFTAGEPDFDTPAPIVEAAKKALDDGYTKYTPAAGLPELKRAICEKFLSDNGLSYEPEQIVVSDGAKSSLFHAIAAIAGEGDEVIVPAPYWVTYVEQIRLCGAIPVIAETTEKSGYKLLKEQFEQIITERTKCLILNSPCNPTGAVYTREELSGIAEVCERRGVAVISDEIYEKLVFDGAKHVSIASLSPYMKDNTIVINGVSKTYAMTGWRIGYLAAPTNVASAISAMQGHTTSNACSFAQVASVAALHMGEAVPEHMREVFDKRRVLLLSLLSEIPELKFIRPAGAFYVFVDVGGCIGKSFRGERINGSVDFCNALLEAGVAAIPGAAFGRDDFIRLSYAVSEEDIREGVRLIAEFVGGLV